MKKNFLYIIVGIILGIVLLACTSKVVAQTNNFYNVNAGNVKNMVITKWKDPDNSNITCYITTDGGISCLYQG